MPQVARSQSRFTDKVVYLADEVDRQVKKAILTLEIKQPGVLKSRADQPAPSLNGVWNSRIAKQGNFLCHSYCASVFKGVGFLAFKVNGAVLVAADISCGNLQEKGQLS